MIRSVCRVARRELQEKNKINDLPFSILSLISKKVVEYSTESYNHMQWRIWQRGSEVPTHQNLDFFFLGQLRNLKS
jgi:hypothetical protein